MKSGDCAYQLTKKGIGKMEKRSVKMLEQQARSIMILDDSEMFSKRLTCWVANPDIELSKI